MEEDHKPFWIDEDGRVMSPEIALHLPPHAIDHPQTPTRSNIMGRLPDGFPLDRTPVEFIADRNIWNPRMSHGRGVAEHYLAHIGIPEFVEENQPVENEVLGDVGVQVQVEAEEVNFQLIATPTLVRNEVEEGDVQVEDEAEVNFQLIATPTLVQNEVEEGYLHVQVEAEAEVNFQLIATPTLVQNVQVQAEVEDDIQLIPTHTTPVGNEGSEGEEGAAAWTGFSDSSSEEIEDVSIGSEVPLIATPTLVRNEVEEGGLQVQAEVEDDIQLIPDSLEIESSEKIEDVSIGNEVEEADARWSGFQSEGEDERIKEVAVVNKVQPDGKEVEQGEASRSGFEVPSKQVEETKEKVEVKRAKGLRLRRLKRFKKTVKGFRLRR